jgi:RimJ/RimL family protein N-acetyltransferase
MISFANQKPRNIYELAIIESKSDRVIGTCRLGIKDPENREAYVGYTFRKDVWGKGYATEVTQELLSFDFSKLGLHRITASSSPLNAASHRVLEKAGLQKEGLLRKNKIQHGQWRDSVIFAILEEEFRR